MCLWLIVFILLSKASIRSYLLGFFYKKSSESRKNIIVENEHIASSLYYYYIILTEKQSCHSPRVARRDAILRDPSDGPWGPAVHEAHALREDEEGNIQQVGYISFEVLFVDPSLGKLRIGFNQLSLSLDSPSSMYLPMYTVTMYLHKCLLDHLA